MIYDQPFYIDPKYKERLKEMTHDEIVQKLVEMNRQFNQRGIAITKRSIIKLMDEIRAIRGESPCPIFIDTVEDLEKLNQVLSKYDPT